MDILTDTAVLYSFRRCPYAIRARLALAYAGIRFELREVVLKDKPESMLALSAKATVPVLALSDRVIDESLGVMQWALSQSDPDDWDVGLLDHTLIETNDGHFKYYLDRYKYFDRYTDMSQQEYLQKACEFIAELESQLMRQSNSAFFLNGTALSALDIAIYPFVRQFAFVDKKQFDRLPYPNVQKWLKQFLNSNLFSAVMLKYPQWQIGHKPVIFHNELSSRA